MSSVGQALGGVVGAVAGFIIGGPTGALYGAQLGIGVGGLLDPPKGPNLQGPRLSDLSQQVSTYGAPIPRVYGTAALYGNIIWLQGDRLTEVATETESGGGKGGPASSTYTTYSYFATFAVTLCHGPIAGVRRIWVGADLIYDAGSDDVEAILVSNESAELFTLYLGTDTQLPDPLIQADKGVNDTPAYRGIAYLVFDTYPLAKHGNSLLGAQVKVEVVSNISSGTPTLVWTKQTSSHSTGWNSLKVGVPLTKNPSGVIMRTYGISSGIPYTLICVEHSYYTDAIYTREVPVSARYTVNFSEGDFRFCSSAYGLTAVSIDDKVFYTGFTTLSSEPGSSVLVTPTHTWIGGKRAISSACEVIAIENGTEITQGATVFHDSYTSSYIPRFIYDPTRGYVYIFDGLNIKRYDAITAAYVDTIISPVLVAALGGMYIEDDLLKCVVNSAGTQIYLEYDLDTFTEQYQVEIPTIGGSGLVWGWGSNGILFRIDNLTGRDLDIIQLSKPTSNAVLLSAIVSAECLRSNLLNVGDIDVTALADNVRGYRIANAGSLRAALSPLQGVFPFDVVQSGYQITFVPRGGASVDSIPEADLGAGSGGPVPLFALSREMDSQLPRSVHIKYLDASREYDVGEQYAERLSTDAVNRLDLEVAVVLTADEAAQVAERLLYLYWLERSDIGPLVLPPDYRRLEPADVITVAYGAESYEVRLTGINYRADGCLECTGKLNSATIYTSTAVADTGEVTGPALTLAGPTELALLDIPLLRDDDDTAGFPVAMGGYLAGWPGGVLYRSEDEGQSWVDVVASVSPGAVIGYATTSLAVHDGIQMDKASTLSVRLSSGSLASVTELQMFGGANWFAYGTDGRWEIIAAQTVALQGDGSYILSDFMRGQKGTAWASGLHVVNDRIVLLSAAALNFVSINTSSIGSERLYRGITFGKSLDSSTDTAFTYTGINLKCLSPVYLNGNRHPSTNDWTLTWIRRTRVGGEWRDYVDASLGESSESYEIDIFSDGSYTTLKRTLTATSQTVAYTSAQQVTDFGSNQATLYVRVYQLSATVGRGYALQTSITR